MARAYSASPTPEYGVQPQPGDWQALRGELLTLLDQVGTQYSRAGSSDPAYAGFAERMQDLREQVADPGADGRRREALRSVKRQIDRFNDRGEPEPQAPADNMLQSAIQQIRARTQVLPPPPVPVAPPQQDARMPQFDELAQAMGGMSNRLGQLESELKAQRGNASQVKEIADQVSQLSQVVELLAGAVGETGQVKRLEGQITELAQLLTQAPKVDLSELTSRLDELSGTVGRLADLQVQQVEHVVRESVAAPQKDVETARSMNAIEASVRNIYDRIDSLERSVSVPSPDLERISDTMAAFTAKMGTDARPDRLLGLVDALNARINEIEGKGDALGDLRGEIEQLRNAVLMGVEPRFNAIETQIEALGERFGSSRTEGPGMAQLEAQIRQLVARMDQTGEQLSGLARLYGTADERAAPDFEALARLAATRALEAMQRNAPTPQAEPDFAALAEQVAARTSEAFARTAQSATPDYAALADLAASRTTDAFARTLAASAPDFESLADLAASKTSEAFIRTALATTPDYQSLADLAAIKASDAFARSVSIASPDLEALADMAASRASEVFARTAAANAPDLQSFADLAVSRASEAFARSTPTSELSQTGLDAIEQRISRLCENVMRTRTSDDFSGMRDGIRQVDERLARLEASLSRREPVAAIASPAPVAAAPVAERAAPPATAPTPAPAAAPVPARDVMPRNPGVDAPLTEFGFPDLGPVRAALEAKNGPRRLGASRPTEILPPAEPDAPPSQRADGTTVIDDVFGVPAAAPRAAVVEDTVSASSRNTFIEAARRAAQRQNATRPEGNANSLIGKAMSRFQPTPAVAASIAAAPATPLPAPPPRSADVAKPVPAKGKRKPARPLPGDPAAIEPAATIATAEPVPAGAPDEVVAERRELPREGFLLRYRKPILLVASIIAVSFMALNLVMQRMAVNDTPQTASVVAPVADAAPAPAAAAPAAVDPAPVAAPPHADDPAPAVARPTGSDAPAADTAKPVSEITPADASPDAPAVADAAPGPRVIPMAEPATTGSIRISPAMSFVDPAAAAAMPAALQAANAAAETPAPAAADSAPPALVATAAPASSADAATTPGPIDSPVKVELAPESVGPIDLRQAAADGDARAQFEIAAIYSEGRAVPQDFKSAAVWYERAAAQGFAPAQYRLGTLYENGSGVTKDLEQARLWYQRSAEAGNRMGMHNLAALYAGGLLGKQDFASAAEWFERAASRGLKDSQFNLGMLYARGLGVPQNLETSYKWFALAAASGDADAGKARDSMARSLDAEAVKRLSGDVDAWKPDAIDLVANFAPIGTWNKSFNPGPAIATKDVVLKVQAALVRLGYDVGTPDGHIGPKTTVAIKAFERGTGMTEVGAINPRLLAVLGSQPV